MAFIPATINIFKAMVYSALPFFTRLYIFHHNYNRSDLTSLSTFLINTEQIFFLKDFYISDQSIFPPDSQKGSEALCIGQLSRNYSDLLSEMQHRVVCLEFFVLVFSFYIKIYCLIRAACQDHQARESAVKSFSQGHNRMAQIGGYWLA